MPVVSSPRDSRVGLDLGPLQKQTLKAPLRQKVTHEPEPREKSQEISEAVQLASTLFDLACVAYGEKNEALAIEISRVTGSTVSPSLVARWRKAHKREVPNEAQLLALGSEFNRIYFRVKNKHFGWGRKTLLDLIAAAEYVAADVE